MPDHDKPAADANVLFQQESLTLKEIINLASGSPITDWPPDKFFKGLFRDLKDAIGRNELLAARNTRERFSSVRLPELSKFMSSRGERWKSIRDVCDRWAIGQGMTKDRKQTRDLRHHP